MESYDDSSTAIGLFFLFWYFIQMGIKKWAVSRRHLESIVDTYANTPSPVNGFKYGDSKSKLWMIKHLNSYTASGFMNVMRDFHIAIR